MDHRTGRLDHYGFEDEQINDRSNVGVNVANGNVLVEAGDVSIDSLGVNLGLSRAYNSRESLVDGPFGFGWTHSQAIRLQGLEGGTHSGGRVVIGRMFAVCR
ncbi:MAG: DUF6531 domain-containing protein, partial [Solirubrobacteraceae bacterium MAG38_C4-C5]|nr:DUF6531 domain-containing protein [Candidatus Siliceabacter maunaloa]